MNDTTNVENETVTQYVDEFGNPIDPSLIDASGNYIGSPVYVDEAGNPINQVPEGTASNNLGVENSPLTTAMGNGTNNNENVVSASIKQMEGKEILTGMVTFDYNNVPITDIVNSIILDAINKGASDIHFDPFEEGIKIRIRIDGQLNDYSIVPLYVKKNMITRIKIISGMNITESRIPQDGAIRTELRHRTVDLRVSCLPTNLGEKIVIRIMDYSMSAAGIEALDFNPQNLEKVKKMLSLPNGIILVTGATGTGKSTTVYAMLQRLNVEGTNLITVEDPIEMNIGGVNQVQAVSEIGLDFATVLRSILRQDPDVIMIGEIRDDETARIAVRASITGHLVLSTIHTNNSLNTIERLTDMSVERYLLGSSLEGIVSQKLARRLCNKCKRKRPTTDYEKDIFKKVLNKDIAEIYEPVGCPECSRGYRGRIAIHEVLLLNQQIKDAITKGVAKDVLRELVYGHGGTETMLQDGLEKVLAGDTSFAEILKLIDLEDDLGSGTQLGLENQINAAAMNHHYHDDGEEDDEEIILRPKRHKKRKIIEFDPDDFADDDDDEIPLPKKHKAQATPEKDTYDEEDKENEETPTIDLADISERVANLTDNEENYDKEQISSLLDEISGCLPNLAASEDNVDAVTNIAHHLDMLFLDDRINEDGELKEKMLKTLDLVSDYITNNTLSMLDENMDYDASTLSEEELDNIFADIDLDE